MRERSSQALSAPAVADGHLPGAFQSQRMHPDMQKWQHMIPKTWNQDEGKNATSSWDFMLEPKRLH